MAVRQTQEREARAKAKEVARELQNRRWKPPGRRGAQVAGRAAEWAAWAEEGWTTSRVGSTRLEVTAVPQAAAWVASQHRTSRQNPSSQRKITRDSIFCWLSWLLTLTFFHPAQAKHILESDEVGQQRKERRQLCRPAQVRGRKGVQPTGGFSEAKVKGKVPRRPHRKVCISFKLSSSCLHMSCC